MDINNFSFYNDPNIRTYIEEIGKFPLLTVEEEKRLFIEYNNTHSEEIKKEIANRNLRLVVHIAKKYYNENHMFLDLVQEGNIGLLIAIDKYDVNMGAKFSTYASFWIRQSIERNLINKYNDIRKPVGLTGNQRIIHRVIREFYQHNGYEPSNEQLSEITGYSVEQIIKAKKENYQIVSLQSEHYVNDKKQNHTLEEVIYNKDNLSLEEQVVNKIFVEEILEYLTDKQRRAVEERFGLDGLGEKTYEEVGSIHNITRKGASINVIRAVKILRRKIDL